MNATTPSAIIIENLSPVSYRGVPVITTDLLARCYDAKPIQIQQNYLNNTGRFAEGRHLFKVEGADLRALKTDSKISSQFEISKYTKSLTLWTARGAARHAKMIETDQAWNMFEKLEDSYFRPIEEARQPETESRPQTAAAPKPLSLREKRLLVAECRKINGIRAAQKMWADLGMPGIGPDQLSLPDLTGRSFKPGMGVLFLEDRAVIYDSADFKMNGGETAVVICPTDFKDNGPRIATIEGHAVNTYWLDRSAELAPRPTYDGRGMTYPVAYVLGRVIQTLPAATA